MIFYRDGIELHIDAPPRVYRHRGHVVEEYSIRGKPGFFVTLAGSHYCAHGDTLQWAIDAAIWKDEAMRPDRAALIEKIRKRKKTYKVSAMEFRVITGACDTGVRERMKQLNLPLGARLTLAEIEKIGGDWVQKFLSAINERA